MAFEELVEEASHQDQVADTFKLDVKNLASVVLSRLVEEVKNDEVHPSMAYDRVHNRHNR
jgi:hypothetical protein